MYSNVIQSYIYVIFQILFHYWHYKILNIVPCATQQVLVVCLLLISYLSRSMYLLGEGNGNPLQYSCLENPRDGGAWWAAVYGVAQSWT